MTPVFITIIVITAYAVSQSRNQTKLLERETSNAINGLFAILVLMHHYALFFEIYRFSGFYRLISDEMGQQVVVPFLVISGYGTMLSMQSKGHQYIISFPKAKILRLLLRFDVCVLLYYSLNLFFGIEVGYRRLFLSLLSIESIGNSNWYITVTLFLYVLIYACFLRSRSRQTSMLLMFFLISIYTVISILIYFPTRYYNTIIAFPLGMLIAAHEPSIICYLDNLTGGKNGPLILSLTLLLAFSHYGRIHYPNQFLYTASYWIESISFSLIIIIISFYFRISSRLLSWFGNHVFETYMMQRLPMIFLNNTGILLNSIILKFFVVTTTTVLLSILVDKIFSALDHLHSFFSKNPIFDF